MAKKPRGSRALDAARDCLKPSLQKRLEIGWTVEEIS